MRILRDTGATLKVTFYSNETATEADGAVTITIKREDGTVLVNAAATTNDPAVGVYTYNLAAQAQLDVLEAAWTGVFGGVSQTVRTTVEVVGGFYLPLAEIRGLTGLSDTAIFTTAELQDARNWFEDTLERYIGYALVPRYHRDVLDGDGTDTIILGKFFPRTIISAKVDGTAVTDLSDWFVTPMGRLFRDDGGVFTSGLKTVEVKYEHGEDVPSEEVRRVARSAIRARLLGDESGIPTNARSLESSAGSVALDLAGPGRPTGIPEMDALIASLSIPLVG